MFLVRIEPVGWLVENEDGGIVDDRLRETGAMAKTFRERLDTLVQNGAEETHLDYALDRARFLRPAKTAQLGGEVEETAHRHVGVGGRVLGQVTDQAFGRDRVALDVVATYADLAGGRRDEAGDHPHGGGFAGAVGAEKPEHLPAFDAERNVVHRPLCAEIFAQILNFNHGEPVRFVFTKIGAEKINKILNAQGKKLRPSSSFHGFALPPPWSR